MQPEITGLLPLSDEMPAYRQLIDKLGKPGASIRVVVLDAARPYLIASLGASIRVVVLDAARPYLIASLYHNLKRPLLVVTAQPEGSKKNLDRRYRAKALPRT